MFSSSNPLASSIHGLPPPSSTFFSQEKYGVYFNHHPLVAKEYCSSDRAPPLVKDSEYLQNGDNGYHQNLKSEQFSLSKKSVSGSKKDRHSKIFTTQGPRNRRVRLSIAISKKFFGVQDLLGFDKPSEVLEWLFSKSKTAINDLIKMKHTSSSTLLEQCEEIFMEKEDYLDKKGKECIDIGAKKKKHNMKSGFNANLAFRNQSRAEARSRARERTIEKLRVKKLDNDMKSVLGDHNYYHLESRSYGNQVQSLSNHEVNVGKLLTEQKVPKPYSLIYNSHFS